MQHKRKLMAEDRVLQLPATCVAGTARGERLDAEAIGAGCNRQEGRGWRITTSATFHIASSQQEETLAHSTLAFGGPSNDSAPVACCGGLLSHSCKLLALGARDEGTTTARA